MILKGWLRFNQFFQPINKQIKFYIFPLGAYFLVDPSPWYPVIKYILVSGYNAEFTGMH